MVTKNRNEARPPTQTYTSAWVSEKRLQNAASTPPPFIPLPRSNRTLVPALSWARTFRSRQYDECDVSQETLGDEVDTSVGRGIEGEGGQGRFHVHFGAGRLGLGLVVGTIAASNTPFAIVQRPKSTWKCITEKVRRILDIRGVLFAGRYSYKTDVTEVQFRSKGSFGRCCVVDGDVLSGALEIMSYVIIRLFLG